jgi:hypothetical protein
VKQRLFDDDSRYNDAGAALDLAVAAALQPVLDEYLAAGYCPRDIHYVATAAVLDRVLGALLDWNRAGDGR